MVSKTMVKEQQQDELRKVGDIIQWHGQSHIVREIEPIRDRGGCTKAGIEKSLNDVTGSDADGTWWLVYTEYCHECGSWYSALQFWCQDRDLWVSWFYDWVTGSGTVDEVLSEGIRGSLKVIEESPVTKYRYRESTNDPSILTCEGGSDLKPIDPGADPGHVPFTSRSRSAPNCS